MRGMGPSLRDAGVSNPLLDPTLDIRDANGLPVAANDDWTDDAAQAADIAAAGLAPKSNRESAVSLQLAAGSYTAILRGKDGGVGIGLVELYNVP